MVKMRSGVVGSQGKIMQKPSQEALTRVEIEYGEFFSPANPSSTGYLADTDSLEQPSPLLVVLTKTTYGCLEVPTEE